MDQRGAAPQPAIMQEIANILLAKWSHQTIEKNWVHNFVKCHDKLKTQYSQHYNYECVKCKNSKAIQRWFNCIQCTIQEYDILEDDIYNFDEMGFAMSLIATAGVITYVKYYGWRPLLQSENCEWVISIETINVTDFAISLYLIFKAKVYQQAWYEDMTLLDNWHIEISKNRWTTDQVDLS